MTESKQGCHDFAKKLLATFPEFAEGRYKGEVMMSVELPTALVGWFTVFVVSEYRACKSEKEPARHEEIVQRAITFMDKALRSEEVGIQNLIDVGFLENLEAAAGEDFGELKSQLTKGLRDEMDRWRW